MIYQANQLIDLVRKDLGMSGRCRPLIHSEDCDEISFDDIIYTKIERAVQHVYSTAPKALIAQSSKPLDDSNISWANGPEGLVTGILLLPEDYLRLHILEMSDWHNAVNEAITPDSVLYKLRHSPFPALRGNPYAPACYEIDVSEGRALQIEACEDTSSSIVQGKYIPLPHLDRHGGIELSERALPLVIDTISQLYNTHISCNASKTI